LNSSIKELGGGLYLFTAHCSLFTRCGHRSPIGGRSEAGFGFSTLKFAWINII
jgi:hypothetical protein